MDEAPPPLRSHRPELPEALELIVGKCLNKEPAQRYGTARELSEDLGRYLSAQRVVARRLSYGYRLAYWTRRNRSLAAVAALLLLSLLGSGGLSVRNRILALRKERLAQQEAAAAERLGQSVKDLEWLIHASHQMPLHDTRYEKDVVRERMAALTAELAGAGDMGRRLGAYALGRGHLALHEWEPARQELERASRLGYEHPELDYALGRVLGELYSRALADARRSGDRSFVEKRREELKAQYLKPALAHLARSRGLPTVSFSYVQGLLDYYEQRHDAALLNAHMARQKMPWLYEAAKLEGDVHLSRALEQRDRGEPDQAERSFQQAIDRYARASELAPSDYQVHEALAEAWTRWQEMDALRGRDPSRSFREALAAADRALEADPEESYGHTRKAFAYYWQAKYAQLQHEPSQAGALWAHQAAAATRGAAAHPEDAYAFEQAGLAYSNLATRLAGERKPYQDSFEKAYKNFARSIEINPRFPWALNDYALALASDAFIHMERNADPRPLLARARELSGQAIALDPQYIYAYNSSLVASKNLSVWALEHGLDLEAEAAAASRTFAQAVSLRPDFLPIYFNFGAFLSNHAELRALGGADSEEQIAKALEIYEKILQINKRIPEGYWRIAYVHYLKAEAARAAGRDPRPHVTAGLRALEGCYQLDRTGLACRAVEAQLRLVLAAELQRAKQPAAAELDRAYALARQCAADPADGEGALLLGSVILQRARGSTAGKQTAGRIDEGVAALDRALAESPGLPRALALKGALLSVAAQGQASGGARGAALRESARLLAAAFAGNPLLRRRYGGIEGEVARQLQTAAPSGAR